jgi:DNA (cytosine-5)-methyltransferase 1
LNEGIIIDNFAGGGGASTGIELGLGRSPTFAINHDDIAMTMHRANHPKTTHLVEDVWKIDPAAICMGEQPELAWFSPDCKHFSKAKGKKPLDRGIRGLAWVVIRYAKISRPKVIILENVEEFKTWGPLLLDGTIDKQKKGDTFVQWVGKLRKYGYDVEWKELKACDYGVPTIRKRLFVIARCDGKKIVWPEPSHGPGREHPYRTAAECIDWSEPCPSIFERAENGKRPLADKTLKRIARGIVRYVVGSNGDPFIIPVTHAGGARVHPIGEPVRTVTGANRGELAFVSPTLIQTGYGERNGTCTNRWELSSPAATSTHSCRHSSPSTTRSGPQAGGTAARRSRRCSAPSHSVTTTAWWRRT